MATAVQRLLDPLIKLELLVTHLERGERCGQRSTVAKDLVHGDPGYRPDAVAATSLSAMGRAGKPAEQGTSVPRMRGAYRSWCEATHRASTRAPEAGRGMIIPRLGAAILLGAFAYAFVSYARIAYITGVEGFTSWAWVLLLMLPAGILGLASAILVLRRDRRGLPLVKPFAIVTVISALIALASAPPVGTFTDDYRTASLQRGLTVPPYERSLGLTTEEYADQLAGDLKLQGAVAAIGAATLYFVMTRGSVRRKPQQQPPGQKPAGTNPPGPRR